MKPEQAYAGPLGTIGMTIPRKTTVLLYGPGPNTIVQVTGRKGQTWTIDFTLISNSQVPLDGRIWGVVQLIQGSVNYVYLTGSLLLLPIFQSPSGPGRTGVFNTNLALSYDLTIGAWVLSTAADPTVPIAAPSSGLAYLEMGATSNGSPSGLAMGSGPTIEAAIAALNAAGDADALLAYGTGTYEVNVTVTFVQGIYYVFDPFNCQAGASPTLLGIQQ